MRTPEAATYTGLSASFLSKKRVFGDGPAYSKCGRCVVYHRADLDDWLASRKFASTSQYLAAKRG
jgi:predicted DNA-binding transcriptional regulator AlpA